MGIFDRFSKIKNDISDKINSNDPNEMNSMIALAGVSVLVGILSTFLADQSDVFPDEYYTPTIELDPEDVTVETVNEEEVE